MKQSAIRIFHAKLIYRFRHSLSILFFNYHLPNWQKNSFFVCHEITNVGFFNGILNEGGVGNYQN